MPEERCNKKIEPCKKEDDADIRFAVGDGPNHSVCQKDASSRKGDEIGRGFAVGIPEHQQRSRKRNGDYDIVEDAAGNVPNISVCIDERWNPNCSGKKKLASAICGQA